MATPAGPHRSRDAGPSGQPRPAHPPSPGPAHPGHLARDPARNGARPVRRRPVPGTASRQRPSLPGVSRTPPTRSADRKEPEQPASTGRPRPRPASQPRLQQWLSLRIFRKSMTLSRSPVPNAAPKAGPSYTTSVDSTAGPSSAPKQTIRQPSLTVLTISDRPSAAHPGGPALDARSAWPAWCTAGPGSPRPTSPAAPCSGGLAARLLLAATWAPTIGARAAAEPGWSTPWRLGYPAGGPRRRWRRPPASGCSNPGRTPPLWSPVGSSGRASRPGGDKVGEDDEVG